MARSTFREILAQAVADLLKRGYESEEQLKAWVERLRSAAYESLLPEAELKRRLLAFLDRTYRTTLRQLPRRHRGLSAFTVQQLTPALRRSLDQRILASADLIKLNREDTIRETLQRFQGWATSIPKGGTRAETRGEAEEELGRAFRSSSFRQRRVEVDQGHKLVSSINALVSEREEAIAAVWHSHWREAGYDYREEHKKLDGRVLLIPGSTALEQGYVKKTGVLFTDQVEAPGQEVFCFPGDSAVEFADGVKVAYRRWYSGELTEFVTSSGKTLRATPNHPVLTTQGWVAAGLLDESYEVIELSEDGLLGGVGEVDQDRAVASLAEVFETVRVSGRRASFEGARRQFHGDGCDGNVDVVFAARPLSVGVKTGIFESLKQLAFSISDYATSVLSSFELFSIGDGDMAASVVSGSSQGGSLFRGEAPHAEHVGLGAIAKRQAEVLGEGSPRNFQPLREGQQAFPFPIRFSRIVKVERRQWAGHVFNLETKDGWYVTNGLIVHNCRCYYTYLYDLADLPEELLTAKGKLALRGERHAANG